MKLSLKANKYEEENIYHWVKIQDKDKIYPYMKYNVKIDIVPRYTDKEYDKYIRQDSEGWTKDETDLLWELCERFDMRFIVIFDRFDDSYGHTEEDLKERYYKVSKLLLRARGVKNHPILSYNYNANYDRKRKYELEKYLRRPISMVKKEKKIHEKIKQLDVQIKR